MSDKNYILNKSKPLGEFLLEADLVSRFHIELALQDQLSYSDLRLGEILALRGWLKQETADFFALDWNKIVKQRNKKPFGYYLQRSALIESNQLELILQEHFQTGIRLGTVAVLQGLIKQTTLNFLLKHLYPKEVAASPFISPNRTTYRRYKPLTNPTNKPDEVLYINQHEELNNFFQEDIGSQQIQEFDEIDESIIWVG